MPVNYSKGILNEYNSVRDNCGLFDVSHMGQFFIHGEKAYDFLKAGLFAPIEQEIENALSEFEEIETINNPLLTRMRSEDARYLQERGLKTVIIDQTEEDGTSLYFCFKEKDNK